MSSYLRINPKTSYFLLAIFLVGLFLRLYGLGEHKYWYDEIITLNLANHESLESIISGGRPPLYLVFAHLWIGSLGTSEDVTRLLSIIFGVSSIILIYLVAKTLFNRNVGLLSAFFMSVSNFQIYYSQEIRYYSLYEFLTLVSFYFYIRFLKSKSNVQLLLYVLSTALLYYSHDFAVYIIAAQNLYVLLKFKTLRAIIPKWFMSQFVLFLLIAPRFIGIFTNKAIGEGGPNWISAPNIWLPLGTISDFMGLKLGFPESMSLVFVAIAVLFVGAIIYFLIIGKDNWMKSLKQLTSDFKSDWNLNSWTILVVLWLFVPIALTLLFSVIFKPMYVNRYLICSAPACYILVSFFLTKLNKVIPIAVILAAYIILISPGLYTYLTKPIREDWTEVISYIQENDEGRESTVLIPYINLPSFKWYDNGNNTYCSLPLDRRYRAIKVKEYFSMCKLDDTDHIWLILRKRKLNRKSYNYMGSRYQVTEKGVFPVGIKYPSVTLYSLDRVKE